MRVYDNSIQRSALKGEELLKVLNESDFLSTDQIITKGQKKLEDQIARRRELTQYLVDTGLTIEEIAGVVRASFLSDKLPREGRTSKLGVDLMAKEFPPVRWVVPGILPEGATILAARAKIGKTWLALGLGLSVAFGGRALGHTSVEAGDVFYLALEDGEARLQRRLKQLLNGETIPDRFHYQDTWDRLDEGGVEDLEAWLMDHRGARLVVVDTLKKVKPRSRGRKGAYDEDYEGLEPLQTLAKRYRVGILIIHHTRKAESDDFMDGVSGSVGLTGAADGAMVLARSRGKSDATLEVSHRDLPDELKLALRHDKEIGNWTVLGDADEFRRSQEQTEIIHAIRDAGGPVSPKAVAELVGKRYENVKQLMFRMSRAGDLKNVGGKYTVVSSDHSDHPVTAITAVTAITDGRVTKGIG